MQGYCVKCKATREMKDVTYTQASNGRTMAKGTCPVCGTKMNKFLSKDEAAGKTPTKAAAPAKATPAKSGGSSSGTKAPKKK